MGIFGNKKEEYDEDEVESEIEIEDENRKLKKSLRDLKSENRKSRKEPVKPWGRKERYLVLVIMVVTVLISGGLFVMSRPNFQLPIFNFQIPTINLDSLNIFKEETIEIRRR